MRRLTLLLLIISITSSGATGQIRKFVRVRLADHDKETLLEFLKLNPDIARYGEEGGFVDVLVKEEQLDKIKRLGLSTYVLIQDADAYASILRQQGYLDPFHTYDEMLEEMRAVEAAHPDIAKLYDIGDSWEKTQGIADRDIWAMKISDNVAVEEKEEAEVLYMGCHHAREIITPEVIIYFIHYLVENYGADPQVTFLVDNRQIWLVPMVNPDGHEYAFEVDLWWRKNRRNNGDGTYGVDLNRNYGYKWGYDDIGSSPFTSSEVYRGPAPFSEPETQAIRDLVQRHNFVISLSYHSYGRKLLFPWGYIPQNTPDHEVFLAITNSMAAYNGYQPGNAASGLIYVTNGDADDWLYGEQTTKYKVFGITPEVGDDSDGFFPDTTRILPLVQENLLPNLYVAYAAEQYAPRPEIVHTPLEDTEDALGPYEVRAIITSPVSPLDPNGLYVHYNSTAIAPFDSVALRPTGNPDEYQAFIPGQGNDVIIYYYLSARDSIPRIGYAPKGAPHDLYSFHVGERIPPAFANTTQLRNTDDVSGPYKVSSIITDASGIAQAFLFFSINNKVNFTQVPMRKVGEDLYQGEIPGQPYGTRVDYYLQATDSAANQATDPPRAPRETYHFLVTNKAAQISVYPDSLSLIAKGGEIAIDTLLISNLGLLDLIFRIRHLFIEKVSGNRYDWLTENPKEGIVPGESSLPIEIRADAKDLLTGIYRTNLIISSNDPQQPEKVVPVKLRVEQTTIAGPQKGSYSQMPKRFWLSQNYPNPFNHETIIKYQLPQSSEVTIKILNPLGQEVRTLFKRRQTAGSYTIVWDGRDEEGRNVESGLYLYQLRAGDLVETRKLILLR